jgi:hypothetical protein
VLVVDDLATLDDGSLSLGLDGGSLSLALDDGGTHGCARCCSPQCGLVGGGLAALVHESLFLRLLAVFMLGGGLPALEDGRIRFALIGGDLADAWSSAADSSSAPLW